MEEAQRVKVAYHDVYSPCYFLKEAVNAILKCLGLESNSKTEENCSEKENNKFNRHEQSCQDNQSSSSSDGEPTGPPSTETDHPTNDPPLDNLARRGRTPPRPGISGGRDPETNSTPSS